MLVEQPQVPKSYSRSATMQSHKLWELKVNLNYFWIQIKEISIELDQITVKVLKYPILINIIITQQKEIVGEDNNKYSCWQDMQYTVTIPDFKTHYFSYKQKMLKHCLKVVRCYINTKQRCHLYLSASSCFPLLKSFQLTCQICYNKEITLKRYSLQSSIGFRFPKLDNLLTMQQCTATIYILNLVIIICAWHKLHFQQFEQIDAIDLETRIITNINQIIRQQQGIYITIVIQDINMCIVDNAFPFYCLKISETYMSQYSEVFGFKSVDIEI
ncbi:Hypothetical_protein [Hexamita inflata]|uniref:Hypothetical_protein n=1 Tax=Hexamita inflata TaxID=28002 RepID=A0AA86NSE7_9EUKA|nr:Hypothetical protein HINF_LOCUS12820 [Hexamita inflata]